MSACLEHLRKRTAALPVVDHHPQTGIGVRTRHQFTPAELVNRVASHGFRAVELYPIHYHGVLPRYAKAHPEVHVAISNVIQEGARNQTALLPWSSSFMIHALAE